MPEAHHSIKAVANRTGLTAHVIRVWEKRYGAVTPQRTGTKRRLYSNEEIERLGLLRDVTKAGHSIGHVARLPTEKLQQLAQESREISPPAPHTVRATSPTEALLEAGVAAVKALDARALDETLKRGATQLGAQGLLQRVIAPLAQTIGDLWRDGTLTAAHEHFATATIRVFLGQMARPFASAEQSPVLAVATPSGQLHELGALLAAAAAANLGWHVTYLGASLPAAEIAGAARQNRARAVALSLVYPEDDPRLEGELTRLREALPSAVTVLVGGRAMPAYRASLGKINAVLVNTLAQFCSTLDELRKPAKSVTT